MGSIIAIVVFMFAIRLVIMLLLSKPTPLSPEECDRHQWIKKFVDDTKPGDGAYLVCKICKRLPGGGFEQS